MHALSKDNTRERILHSAEELFSNQGFANTSLRAITAEAGANLASVNYYFHSKEALFREVVARRLGPINQERLRRLEAAEAAAGAVALGPGQDGGLHLAPELGQRVDVAAQAATSPCHSSSAEELPQQPLPGECDKCQFCQMLSATALLPLQEMTILSGRSVYAAHPVDHFYSFRPGELQRPPSRLTPA